MNENNHDQKINKKIFRLELSDGSSIEINLPLISNKISKSSFAFSLHKAGSSLLTGLLQDYCRKLSIPTFNFPGILFNHGLDENKVIITDDLKNLFKELKYCYIGWRNYMQLLDAADLCSSRNVFWVRDPRDRLISFYFSFARSHVLPEAGELRETIQNQRKSLKLRTPDDDAKKRMIPFVIDILDLYHTKLPPENTRIYRYEDVIFKKKEWLTDMVNYFDLPRDELVIKMVAKSHDIRPDSENPNAHIRQVTPGNYSKHFSSETIEILNNGMKKILDCYGYLQDKDFEKKLVFALEGNAAARILNTPLK